jgi:hypothetical protein
MEPIEFTDKYQDLSTDERFRFKFCADCGASLTGKPDAPSK